MTARSEPAGISGTVLSVVLLAAWLGATVFFGAVVAQAAFNVLPTRTLSGALVASTLPPLLVAGLVVGVVVALLSLRETRDASGRTARITSSLGAAVLCAAGQFVLIPRMDTLRPMLESLSASDPLRAAFGRLHVLSVLVMGLAMILAFAALIAGFRYIAATRVR